MSLTKLIQAALATTTIIILANLSAAKAEAYEVGLCEAVAHLSYVDEAGQSGYYSAGEQFPCTTPNNQALVGVAIDRLVMITDGIVTINGYTAVFQNGQGTLVGENQPDAAESGSFAGMSTTD